MMNLATVSKTELDGGYCLAVCEVMGDADDTAKGDVMTLPGFEARPLAGKKCLAFVTPEGDHYFFGLPLQTDIDEGSTRIFWTDANGNEKGHILGKADGTLEIETTGAATIDAGGVVTVKSDIKAVVDAPKIAIKGASGEVIDTLQQAFLSLSTATAGGFPFTNAANMAAAAAIFGGMHE